MSAAPKSEPTIPTEIAEHIRAALLAVYPTHAVRAMIWRRANGSGSRKYPFEVRVILERPTDSLGREVVSATSATEAEATSAIGGQVAWWIERDARDNEGRAVNARQRAEQLLREADVYEQRANAAREAAKALRDRTGGEK